MSTKNNDLINCLIEKVPESMYGNTGSVFYSGRNAFTQGENEPIYLIGANPGGPADPPGFTPKKEEFVEHHIKQEFPNKKEDWSAYLDEQWCGKDRGNAPMQYRIRKRFKALGINLRKVPASNLVFSWSTTVGSYLRNFQCDADECWPFHELVIEHLKPKVIVCLGSVSRDFVCRQLKAEEEIDSFCEDNNRKWPSYLRKSESGHLVAALTHPSVVDWTNPATDPTGLIQTAIIDTRSSK